MLFIANNSGIRKQINHVCEDIDFRYFFFFFHFLFSSRTPPRSKLLPFNPFLSHRYRYVIKIHYPSCLSRIITRHRRFANKFHLARYRFNFDVISHFEFLSAPPSLLVPCPLICLAYTLTCLLHPVSSSLPPPILPSPRPRVYSSSTSLPTILHFPGWLFFLWLPFVFIYPTKREGDFW